MPDFPYEDMRAGPSPHRAHGLGPLPQDPAPVPLSETAEYKAVFCVMRDMIWDGEKPTAVIVIQTLLNLIKQREL